MTDRLQVNVKCQVSPRAKRVFAMLAEELPELAQVANRLDRTAMRMVSTSATCYASATTIRQFLAKLGEALGDE